MSNPRMVTVSVALLRRLLNALEDAQHELAQDEVAELTSSALDRKLERAINDLAQELWHE